MEMPDRRKGLLPKSYYRESQSIFTYWGVERWKK
jgi:hypothetical protein